MGVVYRDNSPLQNHLSKMQRLVFGCQVVFNATPANKAQLSDIPGGVFLRTQGKTAECDAVEDLSAQVPTATDSTGVFALLLDDQVSKIYSAAVTVNSGTITVASEISAGGRLILELDWSGNLATTSLVMTVTLEYLSNN